LDEVGNSEEPETSLESILEATLSLEGGEEALSGEFEHSRISFMGVPDIRHHESGNII